MSSASEFGRDLGLMHEVAVTGRKAGFTSKDWGELAHSELCLRQVALVARGTADVVERVRIVSKTKIKVNLAAFPQRPFEEAVLKSNSGTDMWATVEKRKESLYVDGKKIFLYRDDSQWHEDGISGHELHQRLAGRPGVHPNILDAAIKYNLLLKESDLDAHHISSFEVIFKSPASLMIRSWKREFFGWKPNFSYLDSKWGAKPAIVLLES